MSEIEKMYENAGVKPLCQIPDKYCGVQNVYEEFTAEKQLELVKLIANRKGYSDYKYFGNLFNDYIELFDFDEALAAIINILWLGLTEKERTKIKEILE